MMGRKGNAQRLFAVSSYARAKDGNFTGARRVSAVAADVSNRVIQVDAALRGILASLRAMREICASCLEGGSTDSELAERDRELTALKENISRLSASIAGAEFKMFHVSDDTAKSDLQNIDEAINKMSGKISQLEETSGESEEEQLSAWIRELFGDRTELV